MFPDDILTLAKQIISLAIEKQQTLATAESCTGGLVAAALTAIAGSSAALDRGFVTYSNEAKHEMLGVTSETLTSFGAVSMQTACAMATGTIEHSRATISVSVTGIAGPGGGSPNKPVGLVHFASSGPKGMIHREKRFGDLGRDGIRIESLKIALNLILEQLS